MLALQTDNALNGTSRYIKELLEIYGPWCHFCRYEIRELDQRKITAYSVTLDHVVPKAKGGTRILSNLRLAHRRCNSIRGSHGGALNKTAQKTYADHITQMERMGYAKLSGELTPEKPIPVREEKNLRGVLVLEFGRVKFIFQRERGKWQIKLEGIT